MNINATIFYSLIQHAGKKKDPMKKSNFKMKQSSREGLNDPIKGNNLINVIN